MINNLLKCNLCYYIYSVFHIKKIYLCTTLDTNPKNNEKEKHERRKDSLPDNPYREFPDLLFGTLREDGPVYFDATRFIQAKGDARRHNVRDFRVAFHHWATALADAYGIDRKDDHP